MPREKRQKDEFVGFLVNPQALRRGGVALQAIRSRQQGRLLERLAQAEIQRFWLAEIAARQGRARSRKDSTYRPVGPGRLNNSSPETRERGEKVVMPMQKKQDNHSEGSVPTVLSDHHGPSCWEQEDEFAGFLANPQALRCGGTAVQAARGRQRRGLLERLAQAEIQQFWQAEIAAKRFPPEKG